jgi:hypothetical protein
VFAGPRARPSGFTRHAAETHPLSEVITLRQSAQEKQLRFGQNADNLASNPDQNRDADKKIRQQVQFDKANPGPFAAKIYA